MSFVLQLFGESSYVHSRCNKLPKVVQKIRGGGRGEGGCSLAQWDDAPTLNREVPGLNPLNRALKLTLLRGSR